MKIEIWSDFACPFCFIGKKRFDTALASFPHKEQVEVIYKSYQLNPNAPKVVTQSSYESFAKSHNSTVEQTKQRFKMITESAKTVGLHFDFDKVQMTNTFDAHRVAKYAMSLGQTSIVERLMSAYFEEGLNIADHETLIDIASSFGLDSTSVKSMLDSTNFTEDVKKDIQEARQIGVQGVPFFVINRKYGVSGAQDSTYFLQALNQIWSEEPIRILKEETTGYCEDDHCVR